MATEIILPKLGFTMTEGAVAVGALSIELAALATLISAASMLAALWTHSRNSCGG